MIERGIGIGGSWGSLEPLRTICEALPLNLPAAVFVVLHVGEMTATDFPTFLSHHCSLPVDIARNGVRPEAGKIYVAPANHHLMVMGGEIRLGNGPRENMSRPAIDPLLRSLGAECGPGAIGLVLSGHLNDGSAGWADMKRCGGITIVQGPRDAEASSMPLGAIDASDVDYRASSAELPSLLTSLLLERPVTPAGITPTDIKLEIDIALGRPVDSRSTLDIAIPCTLTCPGCGGVLSQLKQQPPLRYRCQVGHAFTSECLDEQKSIATDEAIRTALRIIDERATLTESMAREAAHNGRVQTAQGFQSRAREYREQAEHLRKVALSLAD